MIFLAAMTGFPRCWLLQATPALQDRLLKGWAIGDRTYKVHLDGYNQLPYLTGEVPNSARKAFIYFNDDGQLVAIRFNNWKLVFSEQKTPGTLDVWGEPFTERRLPLYFNLRMDPYERAQITSNSYFAWTMHKVYLLYGAQAIAGAFVEIFEGISAASKAAEFQSRSDPGSIETADGRLRSLSKEQHRELLHENHAAMSIRTRLAC